MLSLTQEYETNRIRRINGRKKIQQEINPFPPFFVCLFSLFTVWDKKKKRLDDITLNVIDIQFYQHLFWLCLLERVNDFFHGFQTFSKRMNMCVSKK